MGDPVRDLIWHAVRQNRPLARVVLEIVRAHGAVPETAVPWLSRAFQVGEDEVRRVVEASGAVGRRACEVLLCRGEACMAANGKAIERAVCDRLGVQPGQTTRDGRFEVKVIYCLGNCSNAPSIVVGEDLLDRTTREGAVRAIDRARQG